MFTSLALAAAPHFAHPVLGLGFGGGYGPSGRMGYGMGHGYWAGAQASRAAETTLAERFAQGDIDEKEYRARLEVLRANAPQPPMGPNGPVGPQK